jgi:hypothetical protein
VQTEPVAAVVVHGVRAMARTTLAVACAGRRVQRACNSRFIDS